ncbi:MAG: BrnT family toxin [Candidatus Omnitrophota bacterium]
MNYNFVWDHRKERKNIQKHKVSFEEAATIFCDPNAMSIYDEKHSVIEDRWITLGFASSGRLIVVCHTFCVRDARNCTIRIFSARKSTRREKMQYGGQQ